MSNKSHNIYMFIHNVAKSYALETFKYVRALTILLQANCEFTITLRQISAWPLTGDLAICNISFELCPITWYSATWLDRAQSSLCIFVFI